MSIYRWAKLDDQSGPDRSIELTSISGWAGKKPSQEGLVFGSVARLPLVGPEHQWVGRQKPKAISNTHTERRIPEQSTQVVSSSISGSFYDWKMLLPSTVKWHRGDRMIEQIQALFAHMAWADTALLKAVAKPEGAFADDEMRFWRRHFPPSLFMRTTWCPARLA